MKFRSFVAFTIHPQIQQKIARRISILVQRYPKPLIRWVEPSNYHLTLQFLADRSSKELDELAKSIQEKVTRINPFVISFLKLGTYPNFKKPRVVWVGIEGPHELPQINKIIEEVCCSHEIPHKKGDFSPHLTLGRINTKKAFPDLSKFVDELSSFSFDPIEPMVISEISIFKSELRPSGPLYTILNRIPLGIE
ncbi:RNA 2',3'-cyclic phosphodiesterase [Chloroflexota bacterium]